MLPAWGLVARMMRHSQLNKLVRAGVLHSAQPLALAEAEQDVIAEYQEDFHRRQSPASQQAAGRSLR